MKHHKIHKNKGISRPPFSKEWRENMSKSATGRIPWNKGKKMSEKYIKINSDSHKGLKQSKEKKEKHRIMLLNIWKNMSEETKKERSLRWTGNNNPMKRMEIRKKISKIRTGTHHTKKTRKKMSISKRNMSDKNRKNISKANIRRGARPPSRKGIPHSKESRKKIGEAQEGEKNWNWKGGISPINQIIRGSLKYGTWEKDVKKRDDYCCQKCGENRISKLVAHHILNFSSYIELRFTINNGITFCKLCHKEFHRIYSKKNNTREQLLDFLDGLEYDTFVTN